MLILPGGPTAEELRKKHRDPGDEKFREKTRGKRAIGRYIAGCAVRARFEPRLNVHLDWRYRSLEARPVRGHPVPLLEVEIHGRIATLSYNPLCR